VPRQRDLHDLVRKDGYGAETTSLFDTLKCWDGRFDSIRLDDKNLPAIVHERLLKSKNDTPTRELQAAFAESTTVPQQTWDILLNTHGEEGDRDSFRLAYPFSLAFVHAKIDISETLPRHLAIATLAGRLADLEQAATVLGEPVRFEHSTARLSGAGQSSVLPVPTSYPLRSACGDPLEDPERVGQARRGQLGGGDLLFVLPVLDEVGAGVCHSYLDRLPVAEAENKRPLGIVGRGRSHGRNRVVAEADPLSLLMAAVVEVKINLHLVNAVVGQ
jgi:hypothetical protein